MFLSVSIDKTHQILNKFSLHSSGFYLGAFFVQILLLELQSLTPSIQVKSLNHTITSHLTLDAELNAANLKLLELACLPC